ncbi:MAG: nicotinate phosphoribosyltransferase, partial [Actinomycetota bacterium]|nr:nicotinate phosphoribosyltransferase [Actinomycetota bacterium]
SKRGKRGGRKRLLELKDGNRTLLPQNVPAPAGAPDVLVPLRELYASPPDIGALRQRVLDQLNTGAFEL